MEGKEAPVRREKKSKSRPPPTSAPPAPLSLELQPEPKATSDRPLKSKRESKKTKASVPEVNEEPPTAKIPTPKKPPGERRLFRAASEQIHWPTLVI
jgi:hypothetical protein